MASTCFALIFFLMMQRFSRGPSARGWSILNGFLSEQLRRLAPMRPRAGLGRGLLLCSCLALRARVCAARRRLNVALFVDRVTALIGFAGFEFYGFVADRADGGRRDRIRHGGVSLKDLRDRTAKFYQKFGSGQQASGHGFCREVVLKINSGVQSGALVGAGSTWLPG
jgi:hypothetical protein